jgi:hypothetical protein
LDDHGDGCDFQYMQPTAPEHIAQRSDAIAEQHQRDHGRQREAGPGGECARIAGTQKAEHDTDLAARRSRQELRQRHQVDMGFLVGPFSVHDKFPVEIAEMGDRAAEARRAEAQERGKNVRGATTARSRMRRRAGWFLHDSYR